MKANQRPSFVLHPRRPLAFLEPNEDEVIADQQRALDKHAVRGEEAQHLVLAHLGQLVLEFHGLIQKAAGVEKLFQRQTAPLVPRGQLVISRILRFDVAELIGDPLLVQPLSRLLAGGSLGITNKNHGVHSPNIYSKLPQSR